MSGSKVLKRMWSEMKANFKDIQLKANADDKIPSQKELEDYQNVVQDFVDIFDAVEDNGQQRHIATKVVKTEKLLATDAEVSMREHKVQDSPPDSIHKAHARKDKPTSDEKEYIWSIYVKNDKQFFTQLHAKEIGLTLHRRASTVLSILQTMIDADSDRNKSTEKFSIYEDERILNSYTSGLADSYNSEGTIISALSKELDRSNQEIRSRLRYLKEHNPQRSNYAQNRPYTAEEDKFVADETLTPHDVSLIIGRGVHGIKKRRWHLKQKSATADSPTARPVDPLAADTSAHTRGASVDTLPVVETGKTAALWFEDGRFRSQPSPIPEPSESTSSSSHNDFIPLAKDVECDADPITNSDGNTNKRRKRAADFMYSSSYDPLPDVPNSPPSQYQQHRALTARGGDIEVIVLSDESPSQSPPHVAQSMSPPPMLVPQAPTQAPTQAQAHSIPRLDMPASLPDTSLTTPRASQGTSSLRSVYCPPPPRHGSVYKYPTKTTSCTDIRPFNPRSYADLRADTVQRFLVDLEEEGMTVLRPRLAHDQVLSVFMGYMLQCHSNSNTPAPDSNTIAKDLYDLTTSSSKNHGLIREVTTLSRAALFEVVTLLERAGCLCASFRQPHTKGLQLAEGIRSFTSLCRRHDAYLQSRMGTDVLLLQELLWPRDEVEQHRRKDEMDVLVRSVMRRLAWE